jgi:TPR repeat protein
LNFAILLQVFALLALSKPAVSSLGSAWHFSDSVAQQTKGQGITDKDGLQDAEAPYQLGLKYARGTGVTRDALAARLFRKAAEQGNAEAQAALGFAYHLGRGVSGSATKFSERPKYLILLLLVPF